MLGDAQLHQVRDFIEHDEPNGVNPMVLAVRALRGRRLAVAALSGALAILFAALAFLAVAPTYKSQGLIRVAARIPTLLYDDRDDPRLRLFDSFVSAEVTYLTSRPVLERALTTLHGAGQSIGGTPSNITELQRMVRVSKDKGLISVGVLASAPHAAATTVNALLNAYNDLHAEQSTRRQSIRERELVAREQQLLSKLQQLNARILEVGGEHGTTSIAKAHLNKITNLETIEQRITELDTTIAQKEAKDANAEFDTGDQEIKRVTVLDKAMADMTYDRAKRAARLETLRLRYRADHPQVREVEAEIAVIDEAIEQRRQQIVTLGQTGALTSGGENGEQESIDGLRALRTKLENRREQVRDEAKKLNSKLIELSFVKEEVGEARMLLDETRRALEQVRVESRNSLPGSIEIIAHGGVPNGPIADKRKKLAAAGGIFGAGSGLGLIVMLSFLRPRLRFSDEVDRVGSDLPLIGVIPAADPLSEGFRLAVHRTRNALQLSARGGPQEDGLVIAVAGAQEGSGASAVAYALARSFAVAGMETVLVDGDLGDPALSERLSLSDRDGLREALAAAQPSPSLHATALAGLSILPTGRMHAFGEERLALPHLRSVIAALRCEHDVVIVDTGALNRGLSAALITALADEVVVVVRADESTTPLRKALASLERQRSAAPRLVFNFARPSDPGLPPGSTAGMPAQKGSLALAT